MYASLIILYGDIMKNNNSIKLLNSSYEKTPDTFAKRCVSCQGLVYIKKSRIDNIVNCPRCKSNMTAEINIPKSIKLKLVEDEPLTRQEFNELDASQEDTGSPPRWY